MFKKNNRLSKSKDIETVFRAGRSFFSPYFVVRFKSGQLPAPRIAVVVSTKVSKKAVERNRIKRIIREAVKSYLSGLRAGDYAVIAKGNTANQSPAVLREGLRQVFGRLVPSGTKSISSKP